MSGESFIKTNHYCVTCGKQDVWRENDDGGDYYVGEEYTCIACCTKFYLPGGTTLAEEHGAFEKDEYGVLIDFINAENMKE